MDKGIWTKMIKLEIGYTLESEAERFLRDQLVSDLKLKKAIQIARGQEMLKNQMEGLQNGCDFDEIKLMQGPISLGELDAAASKYLKKL